MLGEAEALVVDVRPFDVHGVGYVDVTVAFRDRTVETARLGAEECARPIFGPGSRWSSRLVANMVVSLDDRADRASGPELRRA